MSSAIPLNRYTSERACIRRAVCACLLDLANVKVCCGKIGTWKVGEEVSEERAGVNVTTRRLVANREINTIGGPSPQKPQFCSAGTCLQEDQLRLLVDIEIVVLTCTDAMEFTEVVSNAVRSCICRHQCNLSNIGVQRIDFIGSSDDFERDTVCELFTLIDTYEVWYDFNHCSGKIGKSRC